MKSILFSVAILMFVGAAGQAFAGTCATRKDKKWITFVRGARDDKNSPTLKEVFDAFNYSTKFFALQKGEEDQAGAIELFVEKVSKDRKVWFDTLPQKRLNDGACGAPQTPPITGYQCRVNQLRKDPSFDKLPDGLDSKVIIRFPADRPELLSQVMTAMSCGGEAEEVSKDTGDVSKDTGVHPVPAAAPASGAPVKH